MDRLRLRVVPNMRISCPECKAVLEVNLEVVAPNAGTPIVYLLLNAVTGLVKIGLTENLPQRRSALEAQGGVPLTLLAYREFPTRSDAAHHEEHLHFKYQNQRRLGEWFADTTEIRDEFIPMMAASR